MKITNYVLDKWQRYSLKHKGKVSVLQTRHNPEDTWYKTMPELYEEHRQDPTVGRKRKWPWPAAKWVGKP